MQKITPFQFGHFELSPVETGRFLLDGGAMFGVVPKTLWSREIPADEKNRIKMAMRSLLIKSNLTGRTYLIDTGSGDKFDDKMTAIYGLDYDHSTLAGSLEMCETAPEDVSDIIFSHLHFDHCGGTTTYDKNGNLKEVFPNAIYHVNKRHWETAINPNAREKASFFSENLNPIKKSGRLHLVEDDHEFEPGLTVIPVNGHTIGQQLPVIKHQDKTIVFAADLFPAAAHIPLPWIMGYDMEPKVTLAEKSEILKKAAAEKWYFFMEHDADNEVVTIKEENGKYSMDRSLTLHDIS